MLRGNFRYFVGGYISGKRHQKWFPTMATAIEYATAEVRRVSDAKRSASLIAALLMSQNPKLKPTNAIKQAGELISAANAALALQESDCQ